MTASSGRRFDVVMNRITIRGSIVGGREDLAEAIAFAAEGNVRAQIQKAKLQDINQLLTTSWDGQRPRRADDVKCGRCRNFQRFFRQPKHFAGFVLSLGKTQRNDPIGNQHVPCSLVSWNGKTPTGTVRSTSISPVDAMPSGPSYHISSAMAAGALSSPHRPKADAGRNLGPIEQVVALKLIQRLVRLNLSMRPLPA